MKINLIILLIVIFAAGGWTYWQDTQNAPQVSDYVPKETNSTLEVVDDIQFNLIDDETINLYEIKNKTIIIHFWATWCAPCLVEFPNIIKLAQQTKKDVVILAVSTNEKKEDIDRFLNKLDLDIPKNLMIAHDPDKTITQDTFKTIKLPESFILTPDYGIYKKIIGASDEWISDQKIKMLRSLNDHSG